MIRGPIQHVQIRPRITPIDANGQRTKAAAAAAALSPTRQRGVSGTNDTNLAAVAATAIEVCKTDDANWQPRAQQIATSPDEQLTNRKMADKMMKSDESGATASPSFQSFGRINPCV
ncbi:hypothetical protein [Novipirellula caenicola]|uniref:Uncharacterized protein n=1 Tax=Novipirellula caenicola TaxID=1536901 RepID=A0ABP9W0K5_9BACT